MAAFIGLAAVAGPLAAGAAPTAPDNRVIAAGVQVAGVAVGGLTVDQATAKLQSLLAAPLAAPIVVGAAGHAYTLTAKQAQLRFDARLTAQRAYEAGAAASGTPQAVQVSPAVSFFEKSVSDFVSNIALHSFRPARDAFIQVTMAHLYPRHDHAGHHIAAPALRQAIRAALVSPTAPRTFHETVVADRAHVTYADLKRTYRTVITVDRATFRLRLFKSLRLVRSYPIAVGRAGLETPPGQYHVLEREVNPSWHVPNSPWAGSLAGQTIPPGPNDPIVARWLGLGNGIGIHGTNEPFSIGSRASHGCIRMLVPDVIRLYPLVPLGTSVYIK